MATPAELETKIKQLDWSGLRQIWAAIKAGEVTGWAGGFGTGGRKGAGEGRFMSLAISSL